MKTAVNYIIEQLQAPCRGIPSHIIEEAKRLEKEQIIEFCWECLRGDNIHTITSNKELIEYINNRYNQTYNQNK